MAFIERMIGPDERLIGIARLHWIYGVKGLAWLGGMIMLGTAIDRAILYLLGASAGNPALGGILTLGNAGFWICLSIGACLFLFYFIMMLATEIGLTTKRLIYKKGLIMVKTEGIDLEEVKGAYVDGETLGRFFNYGTIHFDARFIADIELPAVADPYRFVKAMNDQRSHIKQDGMHLVLENRGAMAKHTLADRLNAIEPGDDHVPQLDAPQYKSFENVEPMAVIEDLKQDTKQPDQNGDERNAHKVDSGPILISELKEDVLEDFEDSSHPKS
jgi:hypothetical protein